MLRLLCVLFLICATSPAAARSLALIIGNDTYQNVTPLLKAHADATGYSTLFQRLGFDVTLRTDLDGRDMVVALATFFDRIQPGDTVAFVFSGHGWSNGSENFRVPTDMRPTGSQTLLERESIALRNGVNGVLDEIAKRGARLTLAIIDACRDNPFTSDGGTRSVGLSRGLVPVTAPSGTFVAFSAGAGQTALDRLSDADPEPHSVFTRHFLRELSKPQDLQSAFKETQRLVNEDAGRIGHPQRPAYYDGIIGSACLSGRCDGQVTPVIAPTPQPARDINAEAAAAWEDFKDSRSIPALQLFARQFAGTAYAALAQERIVSLQTPAPAPQPIPAPKPAPPPTDWARPDWCPRAGTATERAICADANLSSMDLELGRAYRWWTDRLQGTRRSTFIDAQRAWLRQRNNCGGDRGCLAQAYRARLVTLRY